MEVHKKTTANGSVCGGRGWWLLSLMRSRAKCSSQSRLAAAALTSACFDIWQLLLSSGLMDTKHRHMHFNSFFCIYSPPFEFSSFPANEKIILWIFNRRRCRCLKVRSVRWRQRVTFTLFICLFIVHVNSWLSFTSVFDNGDTSYWDVLKEEDVCRFPLSAHYYYY